MVDDERFEALQETVAVLLRKQEALEQRLAQLEGVPTTSATVLPAVAEPVTSSPVTMPPEDALPQVAGAAVESRLGLTVLNRVGVITLILGVAFFFKWAVDNNWIGATGRVLLGLLAGFAALAAADFLWRKSQQVFAQGIAGAGLATLYLATYAAFGFYHLIPQLVAILFLVSLTALAYALGLRYDSAAIAGLGFFGGYLTPVLLSNGEDHPWFLLSYLLLLDAAAMRLALQKRWRALEALAFVGTQVIFVPLCFQASHTGSAVATIGTFALYLLFAYSGSPVTLLFNQFLASLELSQIWARSLPAFFGVELPVAGLGLYQAVRREVTRLMSAAFLCFWLFALLANSMERPSLGLHFAAITLGFLLFLSFLLVMELHTPRRPWASTQSLIILAADGLAYFGIAYLLLHESYREWLGLLAVCVAASYLGVAFLLRRRGALEESRMRPVLLSLGMALTFATLAIPIQLTGFRITMGWAIQGAAVTWIASRFKSNRTALYGAVILILVALRMVLFDFEMDWNESHETTILVNARFATFLVAAVCAFAAARWSVILNRWLAVGETIGGQVVLLSGLTLEVLLWARKTAPPSSLLSVETVSISILFAAYALGLVSIGVVTRTAINRISGLVLVGVVVIKLYLFDIWQLDRGYRIAAFVALGLLLISTSFLYSRFRPVIESLLRNDETPL